MCDSTEDSDEAKLVTQDEIEDSSSTSLHQCEDVPTVSFDTAPSTSARLTVSERLRRLRKASDEAKLVTQDSSSTPSYQCEDYSSDTSNSAEAVKPSRAKAYRHYRETTRKIAEWRLRTRDVLLRDSFVGVPRPGDITEPRFFYREPFYEVEKTYTSSATQTPRPYGPSTSVDTELTSAPDMIQEPPVYPPPVNVEQSSSAGAMALNWTENSSAGDTTQEPRGQLPLNGEQSSSAGSAGATPMNRPETSSAGDTTQEPRVPYPLPVNVEQSSSAGAAPMNRMENCSAGDTSQVTLHIHYAPVTTAAPTQAPLTIHYWPEPEAGVASSSATDTTQALHIHYTPVYNAGTTVDAASNQAQLHIHHTPATGQESPSATQTSHHFQYAPVAENTSAADPTQDVRPENQAKNACTKSSRIICQDLKLFMQLRNRLLISDAVEISTHDYELPHLNAQNAGDGSMMDQHSDRFNNLLKNFCSTHAAIKEEDKNEVIWSMWRTQAQWVPVLARMRASRIMEGLLEVVNDNVVAVKRARDRKVREMRRRGAQTMYKSLTDDEIKHAYRNAKNDYETRPYRSA